MNIVCSGGSYRIFGDALSTFESLPVATYNVVFSDMAGFSLYKRDDLSIKEEKIYGDRYKKVTKAFNSFEVSDRNLGVILSGKKGIGKTLFAKMIADEAIRRGYPVIMVNTAYPGIEEFLSNIDQSVVVIFDEFDKSFCNEFDNDEEYGKPGGPQERLLGLFDGIDNGRKLFVITLNEFYRLSTYFKDRPGRFHYHFSINNPSIEEITEYLNDKISPEYKDLIPKISQIAVISSLNYDCLRAICFDVNQGYDLQEIFEDINISNTCSCNYDLKYTYPGGIAYDVVNFNFYSDYRITGRLDFDTDDVVLHYAVDKSNLVFKDGKFIINPDNFTITACRCKNKNGDLKFFHTGVEDDDEELNIVKDMIEKKYKPASIVITPIIKNDDASRLSAEFTF